MARFLMNQIDTTLLEIKGRAPCPIVRMMTKPTYSCHAELTEDNHKAPKAKQIVANTNNTRGPNKSKYRPTKIINTAAVSEPNK